MSQQAQNPWQRRLRRLTYFIGAAGTFYLISTYALDRMREARLRALKERRERDLLKSHFSTLLSTISFTLYALLPTLSPQLDSAYPVELTSQALQGLSNPSSSQISSTSGDGEAAGRDERNDSVISGGESHAPEVSAGETSSQTVTGHEVQGLHGMHESGLGAESGNRDRAYSAVSSSAGEAEGEGSVSESWASEFRGRPAGLGGDDESISVGVTETDDGLSSATSQPISLPPTDLSTSSGSPPSEMTASSHLLISPSPPRTGRFSSPSHSPSRSESRPRAPTGLEGKSKKELWRDLKIQSITRAITTAYLLPLLYVLTTSQLSTLARERYLSDVKASHPRLAQSDSRSDEIDDQLSRAQSSGFTGLVVEAASLLPNPLTVLPTFVSSRLPWSGSASTSTSIKAEHRQRAEEIRREQEEQQEVDKAEAERLYLTYSWWILHEGWREVAGRVERAVEEVVGPLALKRELGLQDWEGLILDIRRKVEKEECGEALDFTPLLLPSFPLPHTTSPSPCPLPLSPPSPHLAHLLSQTRSHLSSPDSLYLILQGVDVMLRRLTSSLSEELYRSSSHLALDSHSNLGEVGLQTEKKPRLAECLPVFSRWGKGVWEGVPDSGVEALLGIGEFEAFAGLIFGDWA